MGELEARAELQIARLEGTFEQQDGATPVKLPQAFGLGQVQAGKAVGGAQAFEGALHAMPIGIGLDHRPDRAFGARARAWARLWARASGWTRASIGRGMLAILPLCPSGARRKGRVL